MLPRVQAVDATLAAYVLTTYLICNATGSLIGGFVADQTRHHERIVGAGLLGGGAIFLAIALLPMSTVLLFVSAMAAGLLVGVTIPSRDMLVRSATPPGATGKVFGFVYSGLDLGALTAPVLIGSLLDRGLHQIGFFVIAGALTATVLLAFAVRLARGPA